MYKNVPDRKCSNKLVPVCVTEEKTTYVTEYKEECKPVKDHVNTFINFITLTNSVLCCGAAAGTELSAVFCTKLCA